MKIATVTFRTFIAWLIQIDDAPSDSDYRYCVEMLHEAETSDMALSVRDNEAPSKDMLLKWWLGGYYVNIISIEPGPNGYYEIFFEIDGTTYSQDYDLDELKIGELFKYAI